MPKILSQVTIDVVMPCYNSEDTITAVLDGLASQTHTNFRLYIVNNASTDKTVSIINNHPIRKKTTIIQNPANIGFVRNVRRAFSIGLNKYLAICSSNDILYPSYLENLLSHHNRETSITYALSDFYAGNKLLKKAVASEYFTADENSPVKRCNKVMAKSSFSSPFWSLYNRDALTKASPFPFERGGDHVFVAEMALYGKIKMVPKRLFRRNFPIERTSQTFALMENDRYLTKKEINDAVGWHQYPSISILRSHHNMIRRAHTSTINKRELLKSSTVILTSRHQEQIKKEIKQFILLKSKKPKDVIGLQYFHEIEGYINFLRNYVHLKEKKQHDSAASAESTKTHL